LAPLGGVLGVSFNISVRLRWTARVRSPLKCLYTGAVFDLSDGRVTY